MALANVQLGETRERPSFIGDRLVTFIDIPYTITDTGDQGIYTMPKNQFNAEAAARGIQAEADEIVRMRQLLGG